ncbi:hypothetical protein [Nonomuraea gerenzanensis]|uniref:Uncharacterized protein n=1 Tax=Nonomuraea gerenzanensis TaxID=93944 RepID=A0A1M4EDW2_9ACTN|nr:hypothetical protein [Nonomuraea gerenzanensis]UBU08740.1 hypothetical protein LCN96_30635 [Nonomuraea gerenzanensis]SBO97105.1 hypothetical protein BN4615_P6621 [Nonomuraea gerenzanensis]
MQVVYGIADEEVKAVLHQTSLRRNDERLLRLNDKHVYRQYVAGFERMRAADQAA